MNKKTEAVSLIKGLIFGIILVLGVSALAWNGPVSAPPDGNTYTPINVSVTSQTKSGPIWASSFLTEGGGYFGGDVQIVGDCIGCIPSGAVLAFNLSSCPAGWAEYAAARGRAVIGVNPDTGNGLSVRSLGQTTGEEQHTLTVAEMPSHTHGMWGNPQGGSGQGSWQAVTPSQQFSVIAQTTSTGSDQPHNIMQPSVVLLYCQKN